MHFYGKILHQHFCLPWSTLYARRERSIVILPSSFSSIFRGISGYLSNQQWWLLFWFWVSVSITDAFHPCWLCSFNPKPLCQPQVPRTPLSAPSPTAAVSTGTSFSFWFRIFLRLTLWSLCLRTGLSHFSEKSLFFPVWKLCLENIIQV